MAGTMIIVTERGAVGDGKTLNTAVLQAAIDELAARGGGTVTVPPGVYLIGTIELRSNITLDLQPGATLLGSGNLADYRACTASDGDRTGWHLVYAHGAKNIKICGGGTIDGNGPAFWEPTVPGPHDDGTALTRVVAREKDPLKSPLTWILADNAKRPSPMLELADCTDVRIENVTITNSAGWVVHLDECRRVFITGVSLLANLLGPNNDGFDIMSCSDVMISNCYVSCCDDAVCLKTRKTDRPCERVTVTNCVLRTRCAALKLGHGESFGDFRQIAFSNCVVTESHRVVAIYSTEGAIVDGVAVSNIVCDTKLPVAATTPIHIDLRQRTPTSKIGAIRNVSISNVICKTDGRIMLTAQPGTMLENIMLRDIQLSYPAIEEPTQHRHRRGGQTSKATPDAMGAAAAIVVQNVKNLTIENVNITWPMAQDPAWLVPYKIANGEKELVPGSVLYPATVPPMAILWARNVRGGHFRGAPARGLNAARFDVDDCDWRIIE